jgi:hypothetical protein
MKYLGLLAWMVGCAIALNVAYLKRDRSTAARRVVDVFKRAAGQTSDLIVRDAVVFLYFLLSVMTALGIATNWR